jgi:hypothetical protein
MNAQMYEDIVKHIENVPGDVIDFRVYKSASFTHLVKIAEDHGRHAYGMDTFCGLDRPTTKDYSKDKYILYPGGYAKTTIDTVANVLLKFDKKSYTLYSGPLDTCLGEIPEDARFSVAIVDLLQYVPTKKVLEFLKTRLVNNGMIYFKNYFAVDPFSCSLAIKEFIAENQGRIQLIPGPDHYNKQPYQIAYTVSESTVEVIHDTVVRQPEIVLPTDRKVTIALVLKTGGEIYNSRYVNALATNIKNNVTVDVELAVLTNDATGINMDVVDRIIPMAHDFVGWWSKIELFRRGIFTSERVLYFDLDTVIVDNIDDIVMNESEFAGLLDFMSKPRFQTGVMLWEPSKYHHIYDDFVKNPRLVMGTHVEGDAGWIRENIENKSYFNQILPKRIVSFKVHCYNAARKYINIPDDAAVVCFHGKPRPHTITDYKITKHWKY